MVYIPFPRLDLNTNADLTIWRGKATYAENEWRMLKPFLAQQARLINDIHPLPKCWYSELPQGDNYALDVEHFRPKNRAAPLTQDQLKTLEKRTKIKLRQAQSYNQSPNFQLQPREFGYHLGDR